MSITQVNGFQCKDCTDIAYAKKHIDPAHPKDGPYGVNAPSGSKRASDTQAVLFGGRLAGTSETRNSDAPSVGTSETPTSRLVDLSV